MKGVKRNCIEFGGYILFISSTFEIFLCEGGFHFRE
jgi:hypothetical protein